MRSIRCHVYVALFVLKHWRCRLANPLGLNDNATKTSDCGSLGDSSPRLLKVEVLFSKTLEFCLLFL